MWILVAISLLVAVLALGVAGLALRRRGPRVVSTVDILPEDVQGLRQEVAALHREAEQSLSRVATVRYDAFGDMGGHLSWSVVLLDASGSGVLLTSIHGRSDSRTYAKNIDAWSCDQPLSPEEEEAIEQARG